MTITISTWGYPALITVVAYFLAMYLDKTNPSMGDWIGTEQMTNFLKYYGMATFVSVIAWIFYILS